MDKSIAFYQHPNETVRLLRTRTLENIDINIDLTPHYMNDLNIGVVIGTYGSVPYIDMQLYFLKNHNKIKHILVHDDCSDKQEQLKLLCQQYSDENCQVDFYSTPTKMWYGNCIGSLGDQDCFYYGLQWAKNNNFDILVKLSRRLIPCYNWIDNLKQLILESDGITFSSYCVQDRFPIRTECIAFNVKAWTNDFIMSKLKWYLDNEYITFAEYLCSHLAKMVDFQNFSEKYLDYKKKHFTGYLYSGYVHWTDILGTNRYNGDDRHINTLWHMYTTLENYHNVSNIIFPNKYKLEDFK